MREPPIARKTKDIAVMLRPLPNHGKRHTRLCGGDDRPRSNGAFRADRVIGYMINTGGTEKAIRWGVQEGLVGDFSKPGVEDFRCWLNEKYQLALL